MHHDIRGLVLTTSPQAAAAYDHMIAGYLAQRADTGARLDAVFEADPDFALAHCMRGYFAMLAFKEAMVPVAREQAAAARSRADDATERERRHIDALDAWAVGDLDLALAIWESILGEHPLDAVAFRLAHFLYFWLGRPGAMVASVDRILPAWSEDVPAYSAVLACHAFAHEEVGDFIVAEPSGRRSILAICGRPMPSPM